MQAADERRRADDDVQRAATTIIRRGGDPEFLAREVHQAYVGRGWTPGRLGPAYCPNHTRTRMPCGLCPPGA